MFSTRFYSCIWEVRTIVYSDSIEGCVNDHREDRRPVDLYDHGIDDLDDDQVVGFVLPFERQVTMQRSCKDGLMMK